MYTRLCVSHRIHACIDCENFLKTLPSVKTAKAVKEYYCEGGCFNLENIFILFNFFFQSAARFHVTLGNAGVFCNAVTESCQHQLDREQSEAEFALK